VAYPGIIPNHHFAAASECIDLYRDGYSLSAVMAWRAFVPVTEDFILAPDGTFVGE
jgi:hypothetical protein